MHLGTCYYPEHWPRARWAVDATLMADMGLTRVRIGEFAWSRIEPARDDLRLDWLADAVSTLGDAGLGVILCTPTATPPKWLIDERPDILATGADGQLRRFGSRRHYSHASRAYREESARITRILAERFGRDPHVVGWQTDNEYGCHDTVEDYGPEAARAFRVWLADKYATVEALNAAWGNVFWSMEYASFDAVDPPNLSVTEANPAHRLDFQRFSSDQVVAFDAAQVAILRAHSPGRRICHNTMGVSLDFDHHDLAQNHDMLAWDSYPLGFLEQSPREPALKTAHAATGDPDFQGFHHDLYRGAKPDDPDYRWGVMEQQNGPVNWAPHNPAPAPGMVRLWTLEAWAHHADLVSYFRWRQCPFAQEQNHSGLLRVDGELSAGGAEVGDLRAELDALGDAGDPIPEVALLFDYASLWANRIQPQGADWDTFQLALGLYRACRELGLNIDILPPGADISAHRLVLVPGLPFVTPDHPANTDATILLGPRSGSKTPDFHIPAALPPGPLQDLVPIRIPRWQSLRPGLTRPLDGELAGQHARTWLDTIEVRDPATRVRARAPDTPAPDTPVWVQHDRVHYLGTWPDGDLARHLVATLATEAGLTPHPMPEAVRTRRLSQGRWALFNYGTHPACVLDTDLPPAGATVVKI